LLLTAPLLLAATPASAGAPGSWGDAWLIETDNAGLANIPQVAVDASGNAVVVWNQDDGIRRNIWANRYVVGSGWGTAELIETDNAGRAWVPQVAVDASGNAVAVWQQDDGTRDNIWANRFFVEGAPDTTPPIITVTQPQEGTSTNRSSIWVSGTTEPDASVSVNGVVASVAVNGSFGLRLALAPGSNTITVRAWDASGNTATATVNVTYVDPLPRLEQQLAATQADLAAAQANISAAEAALATTRSELAAAKAALDAAEARVAILEQDANVTEAELAAAQANLTNEQVRVAALEAQADATASELVEAQARLAALEASAAAREAELAAMRADVAAAQSELASAREDVDQSRSDAKAASSAAVSASNLATLAMILAVIGVAAAVGALAVRMRARREESTSRRSDEAKRGRGHRKP
jgi:hypothetical protein